MPDPRRTTVKKTRLGEIRNVRTRAQREHMQNTVEQGVCPFCKIDRSVNRVIRQRQSNRWRVWENPFKYKNHAHHIMIVPVRHVTHPQDLTKREWQDLQRLIAWAQKRYNIPGAGLVVRFGDVRYHAGTIEHLHVHIQVPNRRGQAIAVFYKDKKLAAFLAKANKER